MVVNSTTIVGIDCATAAARVGLALGYSTPSGARVTDTRTPTSQEDLVETVVRWIDGSDRVVLALDAPLGWPIAMGRELLAHRAGEAIDVPPNRFFRRTTDVFVKQVIGKQSLDVGADRIARTAQWALDFLGALRHATGESIPLGWGEQESAIEAIEVYPAATLMAHGVPATGYKSGDALGAQLAIVELLRRHMSIEVDTELLIRPVDRLDGAVAVLAGLDYVNGLAMAPANVAVARREGWIWVRRPIGRPS